MADEYGVKIIKFEYDYNYDYQKITDKISNFINEYKSEDIIKNIGHYLGINPFDLFILKKFVEENNIKSILELGAGASSLFIDNLGINRKSFALESVAYEIEYEKFDIFKNYNIIQDYIKNNEVDMFIIDCEHSHEMAKLIDENFLKLVEYKKPVFIHDWFDYDKIGYSEQRYYLDYIVKNYDVEYMTDLPNDCVLSLLKLNSEINKNNEEFTNIPRCSAILKSKK